MLITLLIATVVAEAPLPMGATPHPAKVYVPVVQGEADLRHQSTATYGMTTVKHAKLDQILAWEPAEGSLEDATIHERGLVYQALKKPVPDDAPALTQVKVDETTGLRWEVDGGTTFFVGTSWHCPELRVELTTFGPDEGLVRQVHTASLVGADCTPTGGLGTSSE